MLAGMIPVMAGMAWLSRVSPGTDYWSGVFGPMVLLGAGMGVVFVPLTTASLAGVRPQDSGAASSMVNVMQQLGGSVGSRCSSRSSAPRPGPRWRTPPRA